MYIKVIEEGCPVCRGVVKGNYFHRYYCETCNFFLSYKSLASKKVVKVITEDKRIETILKGNN